jgi:outer membrane protein assembly factor BamE
LRPAPLSSRRCARALAVAAALAVAGCSTLSTYMPIVESVGIYKIDVNQGNYLSQDMVDKLKVGMTQQQVRIALGTPLVTSVFREDRWDYVYEFQRQGKVREHRQFTVYFAENKLARWEGDEMPQSQIDLNRAAGDKALAPEPSAQDKGFLDRFLDIFRREPAPPPPSPAPTSTPAPTSAPAPPPASK